MNFQTTLITFPLRRRKRSRRPPTPIPQVPMLDEEEGDWDFLQHERDGSYCDDRTSLGTNKSRFEWLAKAANKLRGSSIDAGSKSSKSSKGSKIVRATSPSEQCNTSPLQSLRFGSTITAPKLRPRSCRRLSHRGSHPNFGSTIGFAKPRGIHHLGVDLLAGPASSSSTIQQEVAFQNSNNFGDRQDQTPVRPGLPSYHTCAHHLPQRSPRFELRKVQSFDVNLRAEFSAPNYPMLRYNPPKHSSALNNEHLPSHLPTCWRKPRSESSGTIQSNMASSMISTFSSLHASPITDPSVDEEQLQDCFDTEPRL